MPKQKIPKNIRRSEPSVPQSLTTFSPCNSLIYFDRVNQPIGSLVNLWLASNEVDTRRVLLRARGLAPNTTCPTAAEGILRFGQLDSPSYETVGPLTSKMICWLKMKLSKLQPPKLAEGVPHLSGLGLPFVMSAGIWL